MGDVQVASCCRVRKRVTFGAEWIGFDPAISHSLFYKALL